MMLSSIKKHRLLILLSLCVLEAVFLTLKSVDFVSLAVKIKAQAFSPSFVENLATSMAASPYLYNFNSPGTLEEAGSMAESRSKYWWLNSGGELNIINGMGQTIQGELGVFSFWRLLYNKTNPTDTDDGFHPQNIFRLVSKNKWQNFSQQVLFEINKDNLSQSPNRNESNGLLLFSRYQDGNNLYYGGIRVDGTAVIKKKIRGEYSTLAQNPIFPGTYDNKNNPNLLPHNSWIGLKFDTLNATYSTGTSYVILRLYVDREGTGKWSLVAEARDDNKDSDAVLQAGFAGIRTDFMDVSFRDFQATDIIK